MRNKWLALLFSLPMCLRGQESRPIADVSIVRPDGMVAPMPYETTKLTPAKLKEQSLSSIATNPVANRVVGTATSEMARVGVGSALGTAGGSLGAAAGGGAAVAVIGEALSHEHRSLTWLWSLNGRTSGPSFYAGDTSSFTLDYSNVVGMDSKEYEPVILQLRPTTNNMRIVSAAKGWTSALSTRENSWDINRTLIEDRVPCKVNAAKTGIASVVAGPLPLWGVRRGPPPRKGQEGGRDGHGDGRDGRLRLATSLAVLHKGKAQGPGGGPRIRGGQ